MFVAMSEGEYDAYIGRVTAVFADAVARGTGGEAADVLGRARAHVAALLPDGRDTAGHRFRNIVVGGEVAGVLWTHDQFDEVPPRVFLYDIEINEDQRGRGVGGRAMRALEEEARGHGAAAILLSVFFHNEGAIRWYERLGYVEIERGRGGMRMRKTL